MAAALISYGFVTLVFVLAIAHFWRRQAVLPALLLIHLALLTQIRPLILLTGLDYPLLMNSPSDSWLAMTVTHLAILLWLVTFLIAQATLTLAAPVMQPLLPPSRMPRNLSLVGLAALTLGGVGVGITLIFAQSVGGLSQFIFEVKGQKAFAGSYVIRQMCVLAALISVYGFVVCLSRRNDEERRKWLLAAFFLTIMGLCLGANFLWGNRMNIALVGIVFIMSVHLHLRRFSLFELFILGVLAAAGLQGLRYLRELSVSSVLQRDAITLDGLGFWRGLSLSLHFAEYDALVLAIRDLGTAFTARGGEDFHNGLVSWIPRAIWPDKPDTFHVGGWFRRIYEPTRVNGWPVTPIGSWFVNFGWIGIMMGAAVTGMVVNALRYRFRDAGQDPWQTVVGLGAVVFLMDGGVNTGFPQAVFLYSMPLYVMVFLIAVFTPRASGRARRAPRSFSRT